MKKKGIEGICVWGEPKFPPGYMFCGAFMVDLDIDSVFYIALRKSDLAKLNPIEVAGYLGELVQRELVYYVHKANRGTVL